MRTALPVELRPVAAAHRRFTEALHDMLDPAWGRYAPEYARQQCVRDTRPFRISRQACTDAPSFLAELEQVLLRRLYQEETVRKYTGCVRRFLAWADSLCWLPRAVSARIGTVAWRQMVARAVERYHRHTASSHPLEFSRRRHFF